MIKNSKKLKIWVIGRNYPSRKNRMAGSFELDQAKMLAKNGHIVTYVTLVFHPFKKIHKWGYHTWFEDNVRICSFSQFFFLERMRIHWPKFKKHCWSNFLKLVEADAGIPDIIHVHYPALITEPDVVLQYKKFETKIIVTEHWTKVQNNKLSKIDALHLEQYVKNSDVVISVGRNLRKAIIAITGTTRKIFVIPNVVSNNFFPSVADNNKENFYFIVTQRLVPIKQIDSIILAFYCQFSDNEKTFLQIVGEGPEKRRLKKLVKKLHLENRVIFKGTLNQSDVAKLVRESNVSISYSRNETFCVPIIEAWASGIPAIGTQSAEARDVLRDDNFGFLVDSSNIKTLEYAMKESYLRRDDFNKKLISDYARNHYSEDVVYSKLIALYNENFSL